MWTDWQPEIIEADFVRLKAIGVRTIRCFPLWSVFQPISLLRRYQGLPTEYRFSERPLPADELGQAGISREAMERFAFVADLAAKYQLELVVGLITGWMSGRLFVPPALEGRALFTDPVALMWQMRFVRGFTQYFKSHPAIVAWDLGNECNCCDKAQSREVAWVWSSMITNAIRAVDATRPVISGMHSLKTDRSAIWHIEDQAELTDVLTIHPYPAFTPHCDREPLNAMRSVLHSTAESVFYSSIGGKPCFTEELGSLSSIFGSEEISGDYLRNVLFSLWSHGDLGLLWWCGFDQKHLENAPYDWYAVERELGLYHLHGNEWTPKPAAESLATFSQFLQTAPALPPHCREAVCILTESQDSWGAAYSAFILAKQAGFDIDFQTAQQPLRDSGLYLMPSVREQPSRRFGLELLERVKQGATLYVSLDDAMLAEVKDWFGIEVQTRQQRRAPATIQFEETTFEIPSPYRLVVKLAGADALAVEPDGNPLYTHVAHGLGHVYFLQVPLETHLAQLPGAFDSDSCPYWKFYSCFSEVVRQERVVEKGPQQVGITEHPHDAAYRYVTLINYTPETVSFPLKLKPGWKIAETFYGTLHEDGTAQIANNDAVILGVIRE